MAGLTLFLQTFQLVVRVRILVATRMMGYGSEIRDLLWSDVYVGLVCVSDLVLARCYQGSEPRVDFPGEVREPG
jgi:hypothetical protein